MDTILFWTQQEKQMISMNEHKVLFLYSHICFGQYDYPNVISLKHTL